jgi:asparagine synthase (glutamine-hydrolysing)
MRVQSKNPIPPILANDKPRYAEKGKLYSKLYSDFHASALPLNLRDYDRLSMAHGVEVRSPFCDWRLVCYSFSLPSNSILGGGFTKRVLRESMVGLIPEKIRLRRDKVGFANPVSNWWTPSVKDYILDMVRSDVFLNSSIWNGPNVAKEVEGNLRVNSFADAWRFWPTIQSNLLIQEFRNFKSKIQKFCCE